MATGTGKTRTCIGLTYRLLKTRRFRRVLFLVDRSALGEQAAERLQGGPPREPPDLRRDLRPQGARRTKPDPDTAAHRHHSGHGQAHPLPSTRTPSAPPSISTTASSSTSATAATSSTARSATPRSTFRDQSDYISKYRRVLDHFDAVKVGLTATPALHTTEIFGRPVFKYSYREAVIDGVLIDHEPPTRSSPSSPRTACTGTPASRWRSTGPEAGDRHRRPARRGPPRGRRFNKRRHHRELQPRRLRRARPPHRPLPRRQDAHLLRQRRPRRPRRRLLKEALARRYGAVEDDAVVKITGASDKPLQLIRRYKNERNPNIAVTVDLLTTGIDVPRISNIVFLRRVRSRILYEQMLGRATRRCDEIGKEVFHIFDAVDLYSALEDVSTMKPVVVDPKATFATLVQELQGARDEAVAQEIVDQIVAKLQASSAASKARPPSASRPPPA
jgi:type I restriction enzyme R subunit